MSSVQDNPPHSHWRPPAKRPFIVALTVLLALAAVLAILWAWNLPPLAGGGIEITDNAYVRGRTTVIAPQVSGYVVAVLAHDYQPVPVRDVLVRIDDSLYQAKVEQAQANLAAAEASLANNEQAHASDVASLASQSAALESAQAQLLRAKADMARADQLVHSGSISVREQDQTRAALAQAVAQVGQGQASQEIARQNIRTVDVARRGLEAQVAVARAHLDAALVDLHHTIIRAPEAGQLGEIGVRLGQYVTNGTELMALVPADRWIIADYKEARTAHMTVGQPATFTVDALDDARLTGHVEELSPAAGSEFAVLKPDNATGNFVKVPQRFGVRITVDAGQPLASRLKPGMSVEARVDTRGGP